MTYKFHPEDCVHDVLVGGMFWMNCSRHGDCYGPCPECNIEFIKDDMVKYNYLTYEILEQLSEEEIVLHLSQFLKQNI